MFTEYLNEMRGMATVASTPELEEDEVLALLSAEQHRYHGSAVFWEDISEYDLTEPRVYRLGQAIVLQDLSTQLAAAVSAGKAFRYTQKAYSVNPSLRD